MPEDPTKRCSFCKQDKPIFEYHRKNDGGRQTFDAHCKTCDASMQRKYTVKKPRRGMFEAAVPDPLEPEERAELEARCEELGVLVNQQVRDIFQLIRCGSVVTGLEKALNKDVYLSILFYYMLKGTSEKTRLDALGKIGPAMGWDEVAKAKAQKVKLQFEQLESKKEKKEDWQE